MQTRIVKFDENSLRSWIDERAKISLQREQQHQIIREQLTLINQLYPHSRELKQQVETLQSQIATLNSQIAILAGGKDVIDHLAEGVTKRSVGVSIMHAVADYAAQNTLSSLQEKCDRLMRKKSELDLRRDWLLKEGRKHYIAVQEAAKKERDRLSDRLRELEMLIREKGNFTTQLLEHPQDLCNALSGTILYALDDYEYHFPAGQTIGVRRAIRELRPKIDCILKSQTMHHNELQRWRIRYAILCELLWRQYNLLAEEDRVFAQRLWRTMLQHVHMDSGDDLPINGFKTGLTAWQHYENLRVTSPIPMTDLSEKQVQEMEVDEYKHERATILKTLSNSKGPNVPLPVYQNTMSVIDEVDRLRNRTADVRFYTETLRQTTALLQNPGDENANQYANLANHADTRTNGRVLAGAMLILLGMVSLAACVLIAMASFGAAAPASAIGIAAGTSVLAKGLSILGGIASIGTLYAGYRVCQRTGLSKKMMTAKKTSWKFFNRPSLEQSKALDVGWAKRSVPTR